MSAWRKFCICVVLRFCAVLARCSLCCGLGRGYVRISVCTLVGEFRLHAVAFVRKSTIHAGLVCPRFCCSNLLVAGGFCWKYRRALVVRKIGGNESVCTLDRNYVLDLGVGGSRIGDGNTFELDVGNVGAGALRQIIDGGYSIVLISSLPTNPLEVVESFSKRLRKSGFSGWIVVGNYRMKSFESSIRKRLKDAGVDYASHRLHAICRIINYANEATFESSSSPIELREGLTTSQSVTSSSL